MGECDAVGVIELAGFKEAEGCVSGIREVPATGRPIFGITISQESSGRGVATNSSAAGPVATTLELDGSFRRIVGMSATGADWGAGFSSILTDLGGSARQDQVMGKRKLTGCPLDACGNTFDREAAIPSEN